jgi:Holliday junction DNA helicase RuvA
MIGRVAGVLVHRGADHVVIDVRGVGYLVHVSDRTLAALPPVGEAAALWTDLLVREDLLQLFGFPTLPEKEWHRLLMTVQGVGAKASMAILGALGAEGVGRAVALGDARAVQAAPGVGPKLAARVILELKAKAPALMALGGEVPRVAPVAAGGGAAAPAAAGGGAAAPSAAATAEALSALVNLGYGQSDAAEAVARAAGEAPGETTAGLIRRALKALAPRG